MTWPASQETPNAQSQEHQQARQLHYELPLNERTRTFLRLDFLFRQLDFHSAGAPGWETRVAVQALFDINTILGRGDVRTELIKELDRHTKLLRRFQSQPGVDGERLEMLINGLGETQQALCADHVKLSKTISENEFLDVVRQRSGIPGGTCEFDLPAFNHWINQSAAQRSADLNRWCAPLRPLQFAVQKLLWVTREAGEPKWVIAEGGLFQQNLERDVPYQLVRITLPESSFVFPEISGNPHRFTLRFFDWHQFAARPTPTRENVSFLLSLCS